MPGLQRNRPGTHLYWIADSAGFGNKKETRESKLSYPARLQKGIKKYFWPHGPNQVWWRESLTQIIFDIQHTTMPLSPYAVQAQTVSELTRSIRGVLETQFGFVTVVGEVSNLRKPYSGHLYFTLKDAEAQIRVVLFKQQQRYLKELPVDGREVLCRGRISVYPLRGEYQIIADMVEPLGAGALQVAFERLKEKLADEGLFAGHHKKALPFLPETIFLVTSPRGAALHDFLRVAGSRFPSVPIVIVPVRVQGEGAAAEMKEAIELLNREAPEGIIVLCRGGGSLEDLWAFNEEILARAIFASRLPVVSAVGHEVDFTIADFVADHRSSTPTAAAKDILPDGQILKQQVDGHSERLAAAMKRKVENLDQQITLLRHRLGDPGGVLNHFRLLLDRSQLALAAAMTAILHQKEDRLARLDHILAGHNPVQKLALHRQRLVELEKRLVLFAGLRLERKRRALEKTAALLDAVSPLAILGRGFAVVRRHPDGRIIRSAAQVGLGDALDIRLHEGELRATVTGPEK